MKGRLKVRKREGRGKDEWKEKKKKREGQGKKLQEEKKDEGADG